MNSEENVIQTGICKNCGPKPINQFRFVRKHKDRDKLYKQSYCKPCSNKNGRARAETKFGKNRSPSQLRNKAKRPEKIKNARATQVRGRKVAQLIVYHSRQRCKKEGMDHDLLVDDVEMMIDGPCEYCGETELKMTLDRIENQLGYLRGNVMAACVRCNMIRSDMPYLAWERLVQCLRSAREDGLLKDWTRFQRYGVKSII